MGWRQRATTDNERLFLVASLHDGFGGYRAHRSGRPTSRRITRQCVLHERVGNPRIDPQHEFSDDVVGDLALTLGAAVRLSPSMRK